MAGPGIEQTLLVLESDALPIALPGPAKIIYVTTVSYLCLPALEVNSYTVKRVNSFLGVEPFRVEVLITKICVPFKKSTGREAYLPGDSC